MEVDNILSLPQYTLRGIQPPILPEVPLPRSLISLNIPITKHEANLRHLSMLSRGMAKPEFWADADVLGRLFYKNKNQHRQGAHFWRINEAKRILARFKQLEIGLLISDLVCSFYDSAAPKKAKGSWKSIPSREQVAYTIHRLVGATLILDKACDIFAETYRHHAILLAQAQFIPFSLVIMGATSRLSMLCKAWIGELEECFELLRGWIESFPVSRIQQPQDYERNLPISIQEARRWQATRTKSLSIDTRLQPPTVDLRKSSITGALTANNYEKLLKGDKEDMEYEDLGEVVSTPVFTSIPTLSPLSTKETLTNGPIIELNFSSTTISSELPPLSSLTSSSLPVDKPNFKKKKKNDRLELPPKVTEERKTEDHQVREGIFLASEKQKAKEGAGMQSERKAKQKKKFKGERNEIDDIFGF